MRILINRGYNEKIIAATLASLPLPVLASSAIEDKIFMDIMGCHFASETVAQTESCLNNLANEYEAINDTIEAARLEELKSLESLKKQSTEKFNADIDAFNNLEDAVIKGKGAFVTVQGVSVKRDGMKKRSGNNYSVDAKVFRVSIKNKYSSVYVQDKLNHFTIKYLDYQEVSNFYVGDKKGHHAIEVNGEMFNLSIKDLSNAVAGGLF